MNSKNTNPCVSVFKGKDDKEIKSEFNNRWIQILKSCSVNNFKNVDKTYFQSSDKHGTISSVTTNTCSAEKGEEQV